MTEIDRLLSVDPRDFEREFMSEIMTQRFAGLDPAIVQHAIALVWQHLNVLGASCSSPRVWSPASAAQPGAIVGHARANGSIHGPRLILQRTRDEEGHFGVSVAADVHFVERFANPADWIAWDTRPEILMYRQPLVSCAPSKREVPPPSDLLSFIGRMGEEMRLSRPADDDRPIFYPALLEREKAANKVRPTKLTPPTADPPRLISDSRHSALLAELASLDPISPEGATRAMQPVSALISFALSEVAGGARAGNSASRQRALEILQAFRVWLASPELADLAPLLPGSAPVVDEGELAALETLLSRVRSQKT